MGKLKCFLIYLYYCLLIYYQYNPNSMIVPQSCPLRPIPTKIPTIKDIKDYLWDVPGSLFRWFFLVVLGEQK